MEQIFRVAQRSEFEPVRAFYHGLIDLMSDRSDTVGWKKGIYPSDFFLMDSLERGELYVLTENEVILSCVILNSETNEGYQGVVWKVDAAEEESLIPHALGVWPKRQREGIGSIVIGHVIRTGKNMGKKVVRLDLLGTNVGAKKLYVKAGFEYVGSKQMYYEDTGLTEYELYELPL